MTTTKVPDDAPPGRPALEHPVPPMDNAELVKNLETLYQAGIISTTEFEDVLEGWSRYLRRR
jgi:hypothetical protein